jgi:hypothetical protein
MGRRRTGGQVGRRVACRGGAVALPGPEVRCFPTAVRLTAVFPTGPRVAAWGREGRGRGEPPAECPGRAARRGPELAGKGERCARPRPCAPWRLFVVMVVPLRSVSPTPMVAPPGKRSPRVDCTRRVPPGRVPARPSPAVAPPRPRGTFVRRRVERRSVTAPGTPTTASSWHRQPTAARARRAVAPPAWCPRERPVAAPPMEPPWAAVAWVVP